MDAHIGPVYSHKTDEGCPRYKNVTYCRMFNEKGFTFLTKFKPSYAAYDQPGLKVCASLDMPITLLYIDPDNHSGGSEDALSPFFERLHQYFPTMPAGVISPRGGSAWLRVKTHVLTPSGKWEPYVTHQAYNDMVETFQSWLKAVGADLNIGNIEAKGKIYVPKMFGYLMQDVAAGDLMKVPPSAEWLEQPAIEFHDLCKIIGHTPTKETKAETVKVQNAKLQGCDWSKAVWPKPMVGIGTPIDNPCFGKKTPATPAPVEFDLTQDLTEWFDAGAKDEGRRKIGKPAAEIPKKTKKTRTKLADYATLNANANRFEANKDMALLYARQLRRVPTLDEFLDFLKKNDLFTGDWEENAANRRSRCAHILDVCVEPSFDEAKLQKENEDKVPLNLDRWNNFCKQFPAEMLYSFEVNAKDIDGFCARTRNVWLTREDCRVWMEINWVKHTIDKNPDDRIPYDWHWPAWEELHRSGKTTSYPTQAKIQALRALFNERKIFLVTDTYSRAEHRSFQYALGKEAPGQSWQKTQKPRSGNPGKLPVTTSYTTTTHTTTGTEYQTDEPENGIEISIPGCRAGP